MNDKTLEMKERNEYEKIKDEYNNLYGFNIGNQEHKTNGFKNDLGLNRVKDEFKLKKG